MPGRSVPAILASTPLVETGETDDSALYRLRKMAGPQPSPSRSRKPQDDDRANWDGNFLCWIWLNRLIRFGRLFPRFSWDDGRIDFQLSTSATRLEPAYNLFGLLLLQVTLAISGADGFVICHECGKSFIPSRRPNPKRHRFCADCGLKAAQKHASRAYRRRQADQRKRST